MAKGNEEAKDDEIHLQQKWQQCLGTLVYDVIRLGGREAMKKSEKL